MPELSVKLRLSTQVSDGYTEDEARATAETICQRITEELGYDAYPTSVWLDEERLPE